jgi:hypothetical protein
VIAASLIIISAIWGALALLIFRSLTNRAALRKAVNRIYAHLLEIRLYSDEPALVWQAQKSLIAENVRFLIRIAPPILIMAVPFALLYPQLDAIYGYAPLKVGQSATVTLNAPGAEPYKLEVPPEISIETPPVKDAATNEISWRIRAVKPVEGTLRVTYPNNEIDRSIAAGNQTLRPNHRTENSIEIDYPRTDTTIPWLVWFILISTATAGILWRSPATRRNPATAGAGL